MGLGTISSPSIVEAAGAEEAMAVVIEPAAAAEPSAEVTQVDLEEDEECDLPQACGSLAVASGH